MFEILSAQVSELTQTINLLVPFKEVIFATCRVKVLELQELAFKVFIGKLTSSKDDNNIGCSKFPELECY